MVDFDAIAEHDDEQETVKVGTQIHETQLDADLTDLCVQLLKIFLMAATRNNNCEPYVARILRLDEEDQKEIAAIVAEQEVSYRNPVWPNTSNVLSDTH